MPASVAWVSGVSDEQATGREKLASSAESGTAAFSHPFVAENLRIRCAFVIDSSLCPVMGQRDPQTDHDAAKENSRERSALVEGLARRHLESGETFACCC